MKKYAALIGDMSTNPNKVVGWLDCLKAQGFVKGSAFVGDNIGLENISSRFVGDSGIKKALENLLLPDKHYLIVRVEIHDEYEPALHFIENICKNYNLKSAIYYSDQHQLGDSYKQY